MVKRRLQRPKLVVITGPTAAGKTSLSLRIAKRFGGEVVSADSRQLYRGTEIGSDIIPGKWVGRGRARHYVAEGISHHLTAFLEPDEPITLAEYREMALRKIDEIIGRGRLPIVVGGTGLYIRAIVDNLRIPEVPPDRAMRRKLGRKTTPQLFARLKRRDPAYAARISPNNRRYLIRALEVIEATGKPFSKLQGKGRAHYDVLQLGVTRPREELYGRIESRVDEQIEEGLVKEARRLSKRFGWDIPPMTALGHRQLKGYLEGQITLEEAIRLIKRDTRRYAKRQLTWFRRDRRIRWVSGVQEAESLVRRFLKNS
ncbi:hypothetical protein AMJ57_02710 [Parcubacteria bacterium SG8_24]|nr:MAG: hypothetical protein AMJ57_02710 [Parcubacteria bacterium SG8_24]